MRTRRSHRNQDRLFRAISGDLARAAADAKAIDARDGENLYDAVVRLGIEHDNHESDLYLPVNEQTQALLRHFKITTVQVFRHTIQGTNWYDVPFMFAPFWRKRQGVHVCPDGVLCTDPRCQELRRGLGADAVDPICPTCQCPRVGLLPSGQYECTDCGRQFTAHAGGTTTT